MILALLLAVTAWGQSTGTATLPLEDSLTLNNLGKAVREIESGRKTFTEPKTFRDGICFEDGTCQTTAASASGGSVTVSAGSTITVAEGAVGSGIYWVQKSSASLGGAAITFSNLTSSTVYKFTGILIPGSIADLWVRVNNDSGSTYKYALYTLNDVGDSGERNTGASTCVITQATVAGAGDNAFVDITVTTARNNSKLVILHGEISGRFTNAARHSRNIFTCSYLGADDFNRIDFLASTGNVSGKIKQVTLGN